MFWSTSALLVLLGSFTFESVECKEDTLLTIPQGQLRGTLRTSRGNHSFYAFMGIPYGEKPERLEIAQAHKGWEGVRDATEFGNVCPQFEIWQRKIMGDDDCLHLNVFTRDVSGDASVMVYIHGGGFHFGSSNDYGPEYFMDENVVLVTLNYRLGPLGFLSKGDEILPGNLGLKDQLLALKWVHQNAKFFGGNPNRLTLFGESAGAASVNYHLLSPASAGLFRNAICQSGSALNPWAYSKHPARVAEKFANAIGCPTDSKGLKECLKTKSINEIYSINLMNGPLDNPVYFGPTKEMPSDHAFLLDEPSKLYEEGKFAKVNLLVTATEREGLLLNAGVVMKDDNLKEYVKDNLEKEFLHLITAYVHAGELAEDKVSEANKKLIKFYFKEKGFNDDSLLDLGDAYSDGIFMYGIRNMALYHAQHSNVYGAILAYQKPTWSHLSLMGYDKPQGMTHADDLVYLFPNERYPVLPRKSTEEFISQVVVNVFVSFSNTDNPNFQDLPEEEKKWKPMSAEEIKEKTLNWFYGKYMPKFNKEPLGERLKFWDEIYNELNGQPAIKTEL